jgi:hypothetical protein
LGLEVLQAFGLLFEVKETPGFSKIFLSGYALHLIDHENPRKTLAMSAACVKNRNYSEELHPEPRLTAKEADP